MSLEQDALALLDQVEAYRRGECARLFKEAQRQADTLTRSARREARQRVHDALADLRRSRRARLVAAEADAQARRRTREHRALQALLEAARAALREELLRRWQHPATRATWVDASAGQALAALPAGPWQVRHPPGWPEGERQALVPRLPSTPTWQPDPAIPAGLCFCVGGACLDQTLDGLLADRAAVEAALLAALEEPVP